MNDIITPQFEVDLPYINKKVLVRPFLVKEEKLLLLTASSGNENEIIQTTLQVVQNCVLDKTKVSDLPFFLVDYLFITLRAKSVGETVKVTFKCENILPSGESCHSMFDSNLDILQTKFHRNLEVDKKIEFTKNSGAIMRWPTYAELKSIPENLTELEQEFMILERSIEKIWIGENVIDRIEPDKIKEVLENLTLEQYNKLLTWIQGFPTFYLEVNKVCPKCGFNHNLKYRDFSRFF